MSAPEVVLLAGGAGTRLWPVSREARPKQFFRIEGVSLLAESFGRARRIAANGGARPDAAHENVWAVVTAALAASTRAELPLLPPANLLAEPERRNTAAAIGWAAVEVKRRRGGDAVLAVLPADQHVANVDAFAAAAARAVALARDGRLVTMGIRPTRPETGYGWLETGASLGEGAFQLARFVEKPDRARAEEFFARPERFLWNAGIFFFRADRMLAEIATHMPMLAGALAEIEASPARLPEIYAALPRDLPSIDYGVMERAADVACVAAGEVGWSDVGSWAALREVLPRDERTHNVALGDPILIDTERSIVDARDQANVKVVAVVGVRDVCVVVTDDAVLVCAVDQAQRVKDVVEAIRKTKKTEVL